MFKSRMFKSRIFKSLTNFVLLAICLGLTLTNTLVAQDQKLEMEGTAIIGNKELPKVLYIVPWKPAEKTEITTPPINSILDQALKPIDRKTFRRQVRYHQVLFPSAVNKP